MKRSHINELAEEIYRAALGDNAGDFGSARKSTKTFYRRIARWAIERAERRAEDARDLLEANPGPLSDIIRWTEVEFAEGSGPDLDSETEECLMVVPLNLHPEDELGQAEFLARLFGWITTERPG